MGQGQSSSKKHEDVSMYPEDVQKTHHKVVALREKLILLKAEGKANKKKRKKEIKALQKEKMQLHVTLMKLGKHAQRHFSFWEYVRIIRSTFNSTAPTKQIQGSTITLNNKEEPEKPKTTAMVKQSDAVQYTIFAFYEAYLLKKLHVAMMLKTQKKLHAKGWNDMVMYLYYEIPKIQTSFEKAEAKLMNQQHEHEGHKDHVEDLYKSHIENQKNLRVALQEGVEGKVRTAPEGTQYSFKKKKPSERTLDTSDDGSSGSFRSKESGSSRSLGSSARPKQAPRSSMFGPAYESGSAKKEVYQAPWMKNSRNKFAKATEKARTPIEEEEEEEAKKKTAPAPAPFASRSAKFQSKFKKLEEEAEQKPAPAPAPAPFASRSAKFQSKFKKSEEEAEQKPAPAPAPFAGRSAKFQSTFKKFKEEVKEEPPKEEPPKEEPKEEEPVKEEPPKEEQKPAPAPAPAPFASRSAKFQSKFKKSEEEAEQKPAPAPAPFAGRSAKFQSTFKKFKEEVKEEPPKEEPPKEEPKEEEPVKEEPPKEEPVEEEPVKEEPIKEEPVEEEPVKEEPPQEEPVEEEPVKEEPPQEESVEEEPLKDEPKEAPEEVLPSDDEVEINEPEPEKSPDETESTAKSSVGEEGQPIKRKKKKKKTQLPDGMPETLEIDTSGDEMSLDGDTAPTDPVKKKKKKKKKKIVAATSGDEDGDGEVVKKKKKKKKKVGVSSNSSVVSELSNGSSLPH